jgi:ATP-dependent protease ClpP protease subunit
MIRIALILLMAGPAAAAELAFAPSASNAPLKSILTSVADTPVPVIESAAVEPDPRFVSNYAHPNEKVGMHYVDGDTFVLNGVVSCFARVGLEDATTVKHIELNSFGGDFDEAMKMANIVKQRGLTASVNGVCMSACTMLFQSASARTVHPESAFMYHKSWISKAYLRDMCPLCSSADIDGMFEKSIEEIASKNERLFRFYETHGVAAEFISRLKEEPQDIFLPGKDYAQVDPQANISAAVPTRLARIAQREIEFEYPKNWMDRCSLDFPED